MKTRKPIKRTPMKRKARKPMTEAEREYILRVKAMPCVCCVALNIKPLSASEVHHVTQHGRRVGHQAVLPLCIFHHQGRVPPGESQSKWRVKYGPSVADGNRLFNAYWRLFLTGGSP